MKSYGEISKSLTKLLQKDQFSWSDEAILAFNKLKHVMSSTPVLAFPDFKVPFVMENDASAEGIGVVLMQGGRPLAFLSKALAPKHLTLSIYETKLLAILQVVSKWRAYLIGSHFIFKTDH